MNEKKNIDRLFQEKFKDFEVAPSDAVWNRINDSLPNKKKKRRVVALWWQIGGVAAAIALLLTVGISIFGSDNNTNVDPVIVDTEDVNNTNKDNTSNDKQNDLNSEDKFEKLEFVGSDKNNESINDSKEDNTSKEKSSSQKLITNPKSQLNSVAVYSENKKNGETSTSQKRNNFNSITDKTNDKVASVNKTKSEKNTKTELATDSEIKSEIEKAIENTKTAVTDNTTSTNSENTKTNSTEDTEKNSVLNEDPKKESIIDAIANNEENTEKEKDDKQNRWSITPNVAPVYYGSLGKGSSIDQQFSQNSKGGDINMSYGIAGSYAVSKKLKVRAGVNLVNLNQTTSDVIAVTIPNSTSPSASFVSSSEFTTQKYPNVTLNQQTQSMSLMSAKAMSSSLDMSSYKATSIDQRFGFIEIPLEVEYRLLDKKFGINVIGGFSTFFLNENEIYADIEGVSTLIGEANNINSTSFSANFGLGLDYNLSKQWNINLEPQFKYQINTFNNTSGNYRPFFIGVYTGLSFKF